MFARNSDLSDLFHGSFVLEVTNNNSIEYRESMLYLESLVSAWSLFKYSLEFSL